MFMDFDKSKSDDGKQDAKSLSNLLSKKQEYGKIFSQYSRSWQALQTIFLEDLILS